jgi:hypothetical protein
MAFAVVMAPNTSPVVRLVQGEPVAVAQAQL